MIQGPPEILKRADDRKKIHTDNKVKKNTVERKKKLRKD
jgi:hypothetical protein